MASRSALALIWLKHVFMLRQVQVPSTATVHVFAFKHGVPRRISARGCRVPSINPSLKHVSSSASAGAVPLCTASASPSKNFRTKTSLGDAVDVHSVPPTTVFGGIGDGEGVADGVGEVDGVALAEGLVDGVSEGVGDVLGVGDDDTLGEGDAEALGDDDAEALGDDEDEALGEGDAEALGEGDAEALGDDEDDALGDEDAEALGDGDSEALADELGVGDGAQPSGSIMRGFVNEFLLPFLLSLYLHRTLSLQPLPLAHRFFRR